MNKSRSGIGVAFALALLASVPLVAQAPPTVTFNLTNVEGESLAGVYTSPYIGNVNLGATIPVICDDFSDNSYLPESWSAYQTSLTTINSSTPPSLSYLKWNGANSQGSVDGYAGWDLTQAQAYTTAAILTLEILQQNNTVNPTSPTNNGLGSAQQQIDLSFALWELFDPTAAAGALVHDGGDANWGTNSDSVVPWLTTNYPDPGDLANATQDVESAIKTSASALDGYSVAIYSFTGSPPPSCNGSGCPSAPPQEFITLTTSDTTYNNTPVPEPSSLAVLGAYFLFGGAGVALFGRKRIFRANS